MVPGLANRSKSRARIITITGTTAKKKLKGSVFVLTTTYFVQAKLVSYEDLHCPEWTGQLYRLAVTWSRQTMSILDWSVIKI